MAQIMIIEDEVLLAKSLCRSLVERGHDCLTANSAEEGLSLLEKMPTDIVLLDLQLPGMSGLDAIGKIRDFDPGISVIIATAYATMASAVEAMRSGACDFLRKPLDTEEVFLAVERAIAGARLKQTVSYYHGLEAEKTDEDRLISKSPRMQSVVELVGKLVAMDLANPSDYPPVLIMGETGTGKDLIARNLHFNGKYSDQPFIEVNCTTLPAGLEEAELFGYEKGSFTGADRSKRGLFEAAGGGTIFLNEIGDLTLEAQVKLMQVIEQKCLRRVGGLRDVAVDLRIIAASNRDLTDPSKFREDLYYRLNNATIEIPALRERKEDIPELSQLFLAKFARKYRTKKILGPDTIPALKNHAWPGNVRELRQLMERVTFLSSEEIITAAALNLPSSGTPKVVVNSEAGVEVELPADGVDLDLIEKEVILKVLKDTGGNISEAARRLHLGREALRYRIKKHEISRLIDISG